jgi:hypothetical protein
MVKQKPGRLTYRSPYGHHGLVLTVHGYVAHGLTSGVNVEMWSQDSPKLGDGRAIGSRAKLRRSGPIEIDSSVLPLD